jgi:hypothetical protein
MLKMNTNLYNNDGTLSAQARSLLSPKPANLSLTEWKKILKEFRSQLSKEDAKTFVVLRRQAYAYENKERIKVRFTNYYKENKKRLNAESRAYHDKNKEERNAKSRAYQQQHREKRRAYVTEYERTRRQKDPLYKFFHSIRSQAVRVVKQVGLGKKPTNTFKWVGCSPEELKAHIESLFLEGMTWDNYGRHGWHIDHIRPVSSFKPEEWERINHYTNLQPLWAKDNLSKSNAWEK